MTDATGFRLTVERPRPLGPLPRARQPLHVLERIRRRSFSASGSPERTSSLVPTVCSSDVLERHLPGQVQCDVR